MARNESKEGKLPIPAMTVGSWWGTNPATKSQTGIDVLAADKIGKTLLIGECKYREEFNASDVVDDLLGKRALVKGYVADSLYVFAKHPVSKAVTWMQPSCPWRRRTGRNGAWRRRDRCDRHARAVNTSRYGPSKAKSPQLWSICSGLSISFSFLAGTPPSTHQPSGKLFVTTAFAPTTV